MIMLGCSLGALMGLPPGPQQGPGLMALPSLVLCLMLPCPANDNYLLLNP